MFRKNVLSVILLIFFLSSCAGTGLLSNAQNQFERGLELYNRSQYEEAITHFKKSSELDPAFEKAYIYLGRSYLNLWRWSEAVSPLRTALKLSPEESKGEIVNMLTEALLGAAATSLIEGNYQESINFIREALKLDPHSRKIFNELLKTLIAQGEELLSRGKTNEAIQSFNETIQLSADMVEAYLGLAKAFFQKGDLSKALFAAEKALQIDPSNKNADLLFNQLKQNE